MNATATAIRTAVATLRSRLTALAAVGVLGLGFGLAAVATPAQAQPKQGAGSGATCEIEIDGKTSTVPSGTRVGLFVCGEDGEWHFGWLITGVASAPVKQTVKPVIVVSSVSQLRGVKLLPAVQ